MLGLRIFVYIVVALMLLQFCSEPCLQVSTFFTVGHALPH